ncbi:MAG: cadherin-like domain-containing protein, partial [Pseudomonadota bacterium]
NGNLVLNSNGSFTYTPNQGFSGQDSFTYSASDGNGGSDTATVTITVNAVAPPPPPPSGLITNGLVADFRTGQSVDTSGSTVVGWQDGSGQGNVLTALGDPQLIANATPTGQSAIAFDGTDDLLQRTDALNGLVGGDGDRSMFFVVDYLNPEGVSSGVAYGDAALNEAFGLVVDRSGDMEVQGYGSSNDLDSNVNGVNGGFLVQSVVVDDDFVSHFLNGDFIDTQTQSFNTDLQKLVIGAEIGGAGEAQMQVASVLIYDRALSESERGDVETYLQQLYIDDNFVF